MNTNIPAAILCGGLGTRLSGIYDMPKALAPIAGLPFLGHLVKFLQRNQVEEIHLLAGIKFDEIKTKISAFDPTILVHRENSPLGTAGAIDALWKNISSDYLLIFNGDTLFDFPLNDFLTSALRIIQRHHAQAVLCLTHQNGSRFSRVKLAQSLVQGFYPPDLSDHSSTLIDTGIALLHRSSLVTFSGLQKSISKNSQYSLNKDIYPSIAKQGLLHGLVYEGIFLDFGTPEDFLLREKIFQKSTWANA